MVILTYPMFSMKRCINKDSNYSFLRQSIMEMIKQRDDIYFLMCFPENKGWTYYDDPEFWEHPQIIKIPIKMPTGKRDYVVHWDAFFWQKIFLKYAPDIIWNQVTEVGHLFKNVIPSFEDKVKPVVVNQHHYIIHKTNPYAGMKHIRLAQIAGTKGADMNVYNSDYTQQLMEECIVEEMGKVFDYDKRIIKMGVLKEDLFKQFDVRDKFDKFTIVYNHRLQEFKRWKLTLDILYEIYREGYDFRVIITTHGDRMTLKKYPFVEVVDSLYGYEEYIEYISKCHLNTTNSLIETFCISGLESLGTGGVLVAPDGLTFPELVSSDYPFLYSSKQEQKDIIKSVMDMWRDDREKYFETVQKIKDYTVEHYSIKNYAKQYLELFDRLAFKDLRGSLKPQNKQIILKYLQENKVSLATVESVYKGIMGPHVGNQAFSLIKVKRILNEMGYKDAFINGEQHIILPKKGEK